MREAIRALQRNIVGIEVVGLAGLWRRSRWWRGAVGCGWCRIGASWSSSSAAYLFGFFAGQQFFEGRFHAVIIGDRLDDALAGTTARIGRNPSRWWLRLVRLVGWSWSCR